MSMPFRYRKLGYVALNVTDLDRSAAFYTDIVGLDASEPVAGGPAFLRCGSDHHHVVLYPSKAPGVKRVAFELESRAEMEQLGWDSCDIVLVTGDGDFLPLVRFLRDHLGCIVEVMAFQKTCSSKLIEEADDFIDLASSKKFLK